MNENIANIFFTLEVNKQYRYNGPIASLSIAYPHGKLPRADQHDFDFSKDCLSGNVTESRDNRRTRVHGLVYIALLMEV
jgi:hypothetical protein